MAGIQIKAAPDDFLCTAAISDRQKQFRRSHSYQRTTTDQIVCWNRRLEHLNLIIDGTHSWDGSSFTWLYQLIYTLELMMDDFAG